MSAFDPKPDIGGTKLDFHPTRFREPRTNNLPWVAPVLQRSDDHMTEASTSFTPAAAFANLGIICSAALSLLFFSELGLARDLDGKYANSPLKQWFDSLASRRGPCCSVADGQSIEEVDWDTKDGKYRVRLDGQWIEVPPDALVTVPNKFGLAVVWPYKDYEGRTQIRCFIPGAGG
jgi:hypothetical protein